MEVEVHWLGGVAAALLKDIEGELARLKRMYADLVLGHHALKDVLLRMAEPGFDRVVGLEGVPDWLSRDGAHESIKVMVRR